MANEHTGRQNNNYMHIRTPNGSGDSLATSLGGPGFECLVRQVIFSSQKSSTPALVSN
jgi:hypothetical protein